MCARSAWIAAVCGFTCNFLWPIAVTAFDSPEKSRAKATAGAHQSLPARSSKVRGGYYIEFRAAEIGTYGHSYVAYGRLNARGQPAEFNYADLHPTGGYAVMALGHLLPVPANTEWDQGVLSLPIASSYRRTLNQIDYRKLLAAVRRARLNKRPYWNAVTNNCNHFIAELARAIGLRVPSNFHLAYTFVPALRELNEAAPAARTVPRYGRASDPM